MACLEAEQEVQTLAHLRPILGPSNQDWEAKVLAMFKIPLLNECAECANQFLFPLPYYGICPDCSTPVTYYQPLVNEP